MATVLDKNPAGESASFYDEFVALRRDIHRHPELGFEEVRTSDIVAAKLTEWGYAVTRGLGGTGVVGQLVHGNGGKVLGLRADMDALPIQEQGQAEWRSDTPGVMHACGHDGHTVMLLAAAKRLAEDPGFSGTLNLIFQPAEEVGTAGAGAARMIADGLFETFPCDAVFAMHNAPTVPAGMLLFREGPMLASSDAVNVVLKGRGGHGAMPHTAVDPVVGAASLIMALHTIVSRNVDPLRTGVITVGVVRAGDARNVIPDSARLEITVRALDPAVRDLLHERICRVVADQASSFGLEAEVDYDRGYPPVVNSVAETRFASQVAADVFGAGRVMTDCPAQTGGEDFAFMLEKKPGCYLLIGNGAAGTPHACMVHNPHYDFNDAVIPTGAEYWVQLARRYLAQ
ncbi:amidohydrolase (plasmid) [Sphingopyxis fribergensis]|uniref:Amidohydrolase n=1 Tax=Sphingopyxis fribergensis TaxID=1515612 RepID=A0A0A7PUI9_9SPHN|nr:M20 aminoacylase family protein [Sphingopyxis fribergensis]AJA11757.1 amidohydrolase [Sphingopyxis fribergensis]